MSGFLKFWNTSVGAKIVMAVTGLVLFGFVIGHMVGNWQVFSGAEKLNAYAEFLHTHAGLIWTTRAVVLISVVLHIWSASRLTLDNRAVRPVAYAVNTPRKASFASRNMYLTGAMIFFFVAYHLMQFTWRWTNPEYASMKDASGRMDVYSMVVAGFQNPLISGAYVIAMVLLGIHLWHGISSMFQSLGITGAKHRDFFDGLGPVVASLVVIGEIMMPIAVFFGRVH